MNTLVGPQTVISRDGTAIACDHAGHDPQVVQPFHPHPRHEASFTEGLMRTARVTTR